MVKGAQTGADADWAGSWTAVAMALCGEHDGTDAGHRHQQPRPRVAAGDGAHLLLEAVELAPQRDTYRQQALRDRLQARMPGNEFANPPFEAHWRGWPDLSPKPRRMPRKLISIS